MADILAITLLTIYALGLAVFYPFIYLNLTFTNEFLTVDNVSYYDSSDKDTDQYDLWWWFHALQALHILVFFLITVEYHLRKIDAKADPLIWIFTMVRVIILITSIVLLIVIFILWFVCGEHVFCRGYDPAAPGKANTTFFSSLWFQLAFVIIHLVLLFLLPDVVPIGYVQAKEK